MSGNKLVYGAVVLFTANLINRILGFCYQYFIMRYIGSEAYGLFNMAFPVFMIALVLTTAGIPLAISKMVAEKVSLGKLQDAQKIFRVAFALLFFSGSVITVLLFSFTLKIADNFFPDPRVLPVFQICIPAVFIVSVSSAFRGYFQGLQNMIPSALSQICEQIFRVGTGFSLAIFLSAKGIEWAAAGLAAGMLCGEIVGLLVIMIQYYFNRLKNFGSRKQPEKTGTIIKNIFALSLPITGGRLVATSLSALDTVIIPRQLQAAGFSAAQATSLFGQLSGTALTLLTFPSVFTFALATSLVPAVSEAMAGNNYRMAQGVCSDALRFTLIVGIPSVITLYFFAGPLTAFFNSRDVSEALKLLALGGLFIYLQQTTTGILQGLGKTLLPVLHSMAGALLRIPLLIYLTPKPEWGLLGTAVAYILGAFCIAFLNLMAINRHIGISFDLKKFILQPFSAGLLLLLLFRLASYYPDKTVYQYLLTVIAGFVLYFGVLLLNGGLKVQDLKRIPLLRRIFP